MQLAFGLHVPFFKAYLEKNTREIVYIWHLVSYQVFKLTNSSNKNVLIQLSFELHFYLVPFVTHTIILLCIKYRSRRVN